jgi:hypothetical protein
VIVVINATEIIGSLVSDDGTEVAIRFRKADGAELIVSLPRAALAKFVDADHLSRINYSGPTGGLLSMDEQCAFAVENCLH